MARYYVSVKYGYKVEIAKIPTAMTLEASFDRWIKKTEAGCAISEGANKVQRKSV